MKIGDKVYHEPQLSYHRRYREQPREPIDSIEQREHYALNIEVDICGEPHSYSLLIRHYWNGESWNHYWFGQWEIGDFVELVTKEEAQRRYDAVELHEGRDAAEAFVWPRVIRGIEKDIKEALIKRWEAVCELVSPHTTY